MANFFSNIQAKIEQHPVMASVIVGGIGLAATIYYLKRNQSSSNSSSSTQSVCTDSNGNVVDCNTGLPIGTSGGFSLQPQNSNSDVLTAIGNLGQSIQNLVNGLSNNGGTSTGTTGTTNTGTTGTTGNTPPSTTKTEDFKTPSGGMSLNDIAAAFGVPETWLASWNQKIGNPDWLSHPWWTIPAGTQINIPYQGTAPTYNPPATVGRLPTSSSSGFQKANTNTNTNTNSGQVFGPPTPPNYGATEPASQSGVNGSEPIATINTEGTGKGPIANTSFPVAQNAPVKRQAVVALTSPLHFNLAGR